MRVLMCAPTEYAIPWEINPWMDKANQPDRMKSWDQWHKIFEIYQNLGLKIFLIFQPKQLADMVFTANAGWAKKNRVILSNFKYKERQPEHNYFKQWFKSHGFKVFTIPSHIPFEGQGDFVTTKEAYLFGYGQRSDIRAKKYIKEYLKLKKEIIPLKLINKYFYHLDTCLMYIYPIDTIMYYPGAFDGEGLKIIKNLGAEKIEVTEKEAKSLVCNGVYLKDTIVLGGITNRIAPILRKSGLDVITLNVPELKKSGAGIRCTTLFLD